MLKINKNEVQFPCFGIFGIKIKINGIDVISIFGDPYEIRTRVTAVKGRCPNR